MCCNRPSPVPGWATSLMRVIRGQASSGDQIHEARHQAGLRTFVVATYQTSRGCSCNPGTPALITRRSSLHEPATSGYEPSRLCSTLPGRVWARPTLAKPAGEETGSDLARIARAEVDEVSLPNICDRCGISWLKSWAAFTRTENPAQEQHRRIRCLRRPVSSAWPSHALTPHAH